MQSDSVALQALVDSVVGAEMGRARIPGAAFVFVQEGRVVVSRGYGVADIQSGRKVDPGSTIFRIGSITKVFTATAMMQLHDRGLVALDNDVNRHLRSAQVPAAFSQPVTIGHLLDHTAGFDEISAGRQASSESALLPLAEFLSMRLRRIRPPGDIPAYSTYGITLAGLVIQDVSGKSYEDFVRENIWTPLGMHDTRVTLSAEQRARLATAYEFEGGTHVPQRYEWYHTTPASSINSTAADMAKFIRAQLGVQPLLMRETSRRVMQATHARGHADVPGVAYGFFEGDYAGVRVLEHGGAMAGASAHLVLMPEIRAGFFVASQLEGNALGALLKEAIIDRFFRRNTGRPPTASRDADPPLAAFAGRYRWNVYCRTCGSAAPANGPSVVVNPDSTLSFAGRVWVRIGPLLFRRSDGARVLGFRRNSADRISHLFIDGPLTFERIE